MGGADTLHCAKDKSIQLTDYLTQKYSHIPLDLLSWFCLLFLNLSLVNDMVLFNKSQLCFHVSILVEMDSFRL